MYCGVIKTFKWLTLFNIFGTVFADQFNKEKNIRSFIILNPSVNCRLKHGDLM